MKFIFAVVSLVGLLLAPICGGGGGWGGSEPSEPAAYVVELSRWGIYKDGTHPVETTKGINDALKWASQNQITSVKLPSGQYLIDKDSRINMVSNMRFELAYDAVLQKETNGKENYQILYVGYDVENVTLMGGTYRGDKDTHDYSKKDTPYSAGTHEAGHGILVEGGKNVTVEGVKSVNFTGDGLVLGGYGKLIKDLYDPSFVSGAIDSTGKLVADSKKTRTATPLKLDHPMYAVENSFELSNIMKLPAAFTVYFYDKDGVFLSSKSAKARDSIAIPAGADHYHLVFDIARTSVKGAYLEVWSRIETQNAVVKNSEFAFNRRQGITVGGAKQVLITDNVLHDMKGIAPESGIDLEGGYSYNGFLNSDVTIKRNEFFNNQAYDLILYDGVGAVVEGNHFASKGRIGLAVSDPFSGAKIANNHFDGTRIVAENDAAFTGNKMNDSYTVLQGPNISIDGMEFTDSLFAISAKVPYGVSVSNVTMYNNKKSDSGLNVSGQPILLKNVTIIGEPTLRSVSGSGAGGSTFDNLRVYDYNSTYGLSLPPGTYNNCVFEGAAGNRLGSVGISSAGKYVFNGCSFKSSLTANASVVGTNPELDVTIKDSTFELLGNSSAITILSAKNVLLERNTIKAEHLTSTSTEIIKLNDYWQRNDPYDIKNAVIRGNTIITNIAAVGISTQYAGLNAPPYTIEDNTLVNAVLKLKANDKVSNNTVR